MRLVQIALAGVLLGGSCFFGLGRGLWTPDEPREAEISREMYTDPGVIPTLNGQPFIEKPPLYYWATALSFRLAGGPSVAAGRAVSALSGLLTLVVVFFWIARAASVEVARIAVVMLTTCVVFMTSAHWLRIDALLLLFCASAVWAAWERIGRGGGPWFLALFYAGLVLALWTKGLIGPVLIAAGLVSYAAVSRSLAVLAPLRPVIAVVVMMAATASLAAAIASTGGMQALTTWFYVNHVERFIHPVATGHQAPLFYYAWTLPAAIAPWLVPFFALFHPRGSLWRRDRAEAALVRYAGAMTVGPLAVLSLSSSKREVYLLPLMPALAFLMSMVIRDRIDAGRSSRPGVVARAGDWIQAAILGIAGILPPAAHAFVTGNVTIASLLLGVAGLVAAGAAAVAVARKDAGRAFWIGAASMGLAVVGVFVLLVPKLDAIKDFKPFLVSIDAVLPKGEPVRALGADETLLGIVPFCTGRRVIPIETRDLAVGSFVLVQSSAGASNLRALEAGYDQVAAQTFGPSRRIALWRRR